MARTTPDGYTLLLAPTGQFAILPAVESKLQYDPVKSFLPVALVASSAYIVSVAAGSQIQSFSDLVAQAKKNRRLLPGRRVDRQTGQYQSGRHAGLSSRSRLAFDRGTWAGRLIDAYRLRSGLINRPAMELNSLDAIHTVLARQTR